MSTTTTLAPQAEASVTARRILVPSPNQSSSFSSSSHHLATHQDTHCRRPCRTRIVVSHLLRFTRRFRRVHHTTVPLAGLCTRQARRIAARVGLHILNSKPGLKRLRRVSRLAPSVVVMGLIPSVQFFFSSLLQSESKYSELCTSIVPARDCERRDVS